MTITISARFNDSLFKSLTDYEEKRNISKTKAIYELILVGLEKWKMEDALKLYINGKITIWKASEDQSENSREFNSSLLIGIPNLSP